MNRIFLLALSFIFLFSCNSDDNENQNNETNIITTTKGITIIQNGSEKPIEIENGKPIIDIDNAPFIIRVKNGINYEAISISASNSVSAYDNQTDYSSYFEPGYGFALSPSENGWPIIIGENDGFNSYGDSRTTIDGQDRIINISNIDGVFSDVALLIYFDEEFNFFTDVVNNKNSEIIILDVN